MDEAKDDYAPMDFDAMEEFFAEAAQDDSTGLFSVLHKIILCVNAMDDVVIAKEDDLNEEGTENVPVVTIGEYFNFTDQIQRALDSWFVWCGENAE